MNGRLKRNIEDTRLFRGSEIDSDQKLVENKFKFLTHAEHSYNKTDKSLYREPPAFKVHFWKKNQ